MNQNRIYIVLTLILIILSLSGLIYFYRPNTPPSLLEEMVAIPTQAVSDDTPVVSEDVDPTSLPIVPTIAQEIVPTPTSNSLISLEYGFEAPYSSARKLYEAPENGGTRYTLYSSSGNITVHAGTRWSWLHPGRKLSDDFKVALQPTFVYKISSQTIVDIEVGDTKITIQCVHGGKQSLVDECQKFLSDFRLTTGS